MIVELNTGMIRLFSGTYYSCWEVVEYDDNGNELEVDYKHSDLMASIAAEYKYHESEILEALNLELIKSINFTGGFHSPREYNFTTDELDFELEIDYELMLETAGALLGDKDYKQFLIDNYRSRSGFISFTPDNPQKVLDQLETEGDKFAQALSALINYLVDKDDLDEVERDIYENWRCNGYGNLDYQVIENNN